MVARLILSIAPGAELADFASALNRMVVESAAFEALTERLAEALDRPANDIGGLLLQLSGVCVDTGAAAATGEATFRLELTPEGLGLMAALRAGQRELHAVNVRLEHILSSSVGFERSTVGTESPGSSNGGPGDDGGAP